MPKELVHLWLSRRGLEILKPSQASEILFLIGSIFPDSFFYSPFSSHLALGRALHLWEGEGFGEKVMPFMDKMSLQEKTFVLGMMSHFMADGHWHPHINEIAKNMKNLSFQRFSQTFYHRLIESHMEAKIIPLEDQKKYLRFIEKNYHLPALVAFSSLEKLVKVLAIKTTLSKRDVGFIILCHKYSLKALHNPVIRSNRRWFVDHQLFESFSSLIPSSYKETIEWEKLAPSSIKQIFSEDFINSYLASLSNLFHRLQGFS